MVLQTKIKITLIITIENNGQPTGMIIMSKKHTKTNNNNALNPNKFQREAHWNTAKQNSHTKINGQLMQLWFGNAVANIPAINVFKQAAHKLAHLFEMIKSGLIKPKPLAAAITKGLQKNSTKGLIVASLMMGGVSSAHAAAPVITSLNAFSVAENQTAVATLTASDAENDTLTWSISETGFSVDRDKFSLDPQTGVLTFNTAPDFDNPEDLHENIFNSAAGGDNVYRIAVSVNDGNSEGDGIFVDVTVLEVNEQPTTVGTIADQSTDLDTAIADLDISGNFTDPDATAPNNVLTYTATNLPAGLTLNPTTGIISGTPTTSGTSSVTITATDAGTIYSSFSVSQTAFTWTVVGPNAAPSFTGLDEFSVAENQTAVATLTATDPEGDDITWAIDASIPAIGPDNAKFSITPAGVLTFNTAPDFENPLDVSDTGYPPFAAGDNIYQVLISITDTGGKVNSDTFAITVTDVLPTVEFGDDSSDSESTGGNLPHILVNENVTTAFTVDVGIPFNGSANAAENATDYSLFFIPTSVVIPVGTYDGTTATAIDIPLTITNDTDVEADENIGFSISSVSGGVATLGDTNEDNTTKSTHTYTITNDDLNTAPTAILADNANVSIAENSTATIVNVGATDPEGDTLTYSIDSAFQGNFFEISNTGDISFIAGADFENTVATPYKLIWKVEDPSGLKIERFLNITVTDVDDTAPVITLVGADVSQELGTAYTDAGATAVDNTDGDKTNDIVVAGDTVDVNTAGTYTITYNVADDAGNNAVEVTRTVTITADATIPVITLTGADVSQELGSAYTDAGATAVDNTDGDKTNDILVAGDTVDVNTAGTYTITYNVADDAGNNAVEVTRTVTITADATIPV
ncbi:MAG: immunoglobulin-like domain-containing protein, partial [Cocleimonas sp.]